MSKINYHTNKGKFMMSVLIMAILSLFIINSNHAESGKDLFTKYCAACHKLTDQKAVGPGLAGITDKRSEEWLISWIKDSKAMIDSGDEDAIAIFEEYKKLPMMAFNQLSDEDIKGILSYVTDNEKSSKTSTGLAASSSTGSSSSSTPTPFDEVGEDESWLGSKINWTFWLLSLLFIGAIYLYRINSNVEDFKVRHAAFDPPHKIQNFGAIFSIFAIIAGLIVYLLTLGLEVNFGNMNSLFFAIFPYVALGIFLVGSIYRYTKKGYKVTSLSTQFLEGKQLFWGSQPFHWGLLFLFFGHLIAFIFPSSVLAWNGSPVRLLILEISSFAFALAALLGLALLVYRRLSSKSILVVTNKMDMVVYIILFTQIISGLGVAYFLRWGSSWFASVLTPYLSSVFAFNPDVTAVSVAPIWVQIHIISAFLIIAIIPFTRFMHFLVAPIDYIWRRYQLVIWNWNSKSIRQSTKHTYGKRPRNH